MHIIAVGRLALVTTVWSPVLFCIMFSIVSNSDVTTMWSPGGPARNFVPRRELLSGLWRIPQVQEFTLDLPGFQGEEQLPGAGIAISGDDEGRRLEVSREVKRGMLHVLLGVVPGHPAHPGRGPVDAVGGGHHLGGPVGDRVDGDSGVEAGSVANCPSGQ